MSSGMTLIIGGTEVPGDVDEATIEHALRRLDDGRDAFVILQLSNQTYMQVAGGPGNFKLEYQDGSIEEHYSCSRNDLSADDVVNAFLSYFRVDNRWRKDYPWEPLDLGIAPQSKGRVFTIIFAAAVILIIAALLFGS
ncbi:MAG: hypothetical protein QNJ00_17005 [Woeseiaceae bacterium]|nr:hypothetical protein [Woeseiaceae bacterium]